MSLTSDLRNLMDAGVPVDEAVEKVMAYASPDEVMHRARVALLQEARGMVRATTREIERRVGPRLTTQPSARAELVARTFTLPDGTFVDWLRATADQHRRRAGWQRQHAADCERDAELHERAAITIEGAGVSCLADLDAAAGAVAS